MRTLLKLFFLALLALAGWLAYSVLMPLEARTEFVILKPGSSTRQIAAELEGAGIIRSANAFLLYHYAIARKTLKAGEYQFAASADARTVYERIARGDIFHISLVIPEGRNLWDIAAAVEAAKLGARDEFVRVAQGRAALVHDLDPLARSLEGYLFPDTYRFTRTQSMDDIVEAMVRRFRQEAKALGLAPRSDDPQYVRRIVTMAAIVEKETGIPAERTTVASVYYNRLRIGMPLQADPTVVYAALLAGRYDGVIHRSDLEYDSPYNTYRFPGLPPGPIANPGRASLEAALKPAETPYLYFVATGNGGHNFATTLEQHNANVVAYRKTQPQ